MNRRRNEGEETVARLLDWTRGQAPAERLAAQILRVEGFKDVNPSHPLGGPDGLKDVVCRKDNVRWVAAAYFPRGQQAFSAIKRKFSEDLAGIEAAKADGFAFVTNQELRLREREELNELGTGVPVEIYHLERISMLLNSAVCYGLRLDFLDIEMTKEEQLAFIATRDQVIDQLQSSLDTVLERMHELTNLVERWSEFGPDVPIAEMREFRKILDEVAGYNPYSGAAAAILSGMRGHVNRLQVPLAELKEFAQILDRISGTSSASGTTALSTVLFSASTPGHISRLQIPLQDLNKFATLLDKLANGPALGSVLRLSSLAGNIHSYEVSLDRVLEKLREKRDLEE